MAAPPLTRDLDLGGFPGAPYPPPAVRAAEAAVRREAGWHIAPVYRETVTVVGSGTPVLVLPTRRVVAVHGVTDQWGALDPAGWVVDPAGVLVAVNGRWGWPAGVRFAVDMSHGFESADDLLPVVAVQCQRQLLDVTVTQRSETVGPKSSTESYSTAAGGSSGGGDVGVPEAYRLPVVA